MRLREEGASNPRFHGEELKEEDEFRERKKDFDSGTKWQKPVYKMQQRSGPIRLKHVYKKSGRKINRLGRFRIRPSGWIQRATLNTVSEIQPEAQVGILQGLRLDGFSRGFRTPNQAKFKSNLDNFSIRTQRCNSRRQTPWHAIPEIKNVRSAHQNESNPRAKMFLRFQYLF